MCPRERRSIGHADAGKRNPTGFRRGQLYPCQFLRGRRTSLYCTCMSKNPLPCPGETPGWQEAEASDARLLQPTALTRSVDAIACNREALCPSGASCCVRLRDEADASVIPAVSGALD